MDTPIQEVKETPQSQATPVKKSDKTSTIIIVALLTLIFVVLGMLVTYQLIKPKFSMGEPKQETGQETTLKDTVKVEEEKSDATTESKAGDSKNTTATNTPDIDKDLESLDELDLSGIENDYAEDQLGDF